MVIKDVIETVQCIFGSKLRLHTSLAEHRRRPAMCGAGSAQRPSLHRGQRGALDMDAPSAAALPPEVLQGGALIDLNERSRILCYTPGQELQSIHHIDVHVCMYVEDMWIKNVRYMDINVDEI